MKNTLIFLFLSVLIDGNAQRWVEMMNNPSTNFYDIQEAFYEEWEDKEYERGKGWKQFKRWEWYMEPRVFPSGERIQTQKAFEEREAFEKEYGTSLVKSTGWSPLGPGDWESISYNPGVGRINVVAQHPTNDQIIYAGSPSGGIWKSINGGTSWVPLNDDFPTLGVSGIAIDYTNPETIYIATGDKDGSDTYSIGVVKSTDGGTTWSNTGLSHSLTQFLVCRELVIHPTDPNTLLVATNDGLFKTIDAGVTWSQSASGNFRDIEFHPTNHSIIYASEDQFWRSTDGGDSFVQVSNGLPNSGDVNRMELAVSPDQPGWVYALTGKSSDSSFEGLYLSTDDGVTFQLQSSAPNIFGYSEFGDDERGQSHYDMALAADPNDASVVFVGGVNVWKSTNAGQDWTINTHWIYPSTYGYTHADIHELRFFDGNLYCGSDGGIFKTNDSGIQWTDLTSGMQISQFYRLGLSPQDADLVIGGTQDNGSNLLKNDVWTHVMGADGMEAAVNPINANIMFCTQQYGGLYRSIDGGNSWDYIYDGDGESGAWVTPYVSIGSNTLIIGYENVLKSVDNGNSFYPISSFTGGALIRDLAVAKSNSDIIYVAFSNSLQKTENGGNSWQNVSSNLPNLSITDIQIHPTYPNIVWVTTSGYDTGNKVFVTTNGGVSWENISQNLPNIPANAIVYQEGTDGGLYVGMDVGVYYTDSTLSNWQAFDLGMPKVIVNELEIHYGANLVRAATYGRGIWESELFTPSTLPPEADFSNSNFKICPSDSVSFTDASVNASPGWTWYFPGGSPSTSTLANPSVLYPSTGTYEVSLVVENVNGSDSIAKLVEVSFGDFLLDLAIQTDQYPNETTWEIFDEAGDIVVSGGGFTSANTLYEQSICLSEGCYEFVIYDSYGDGICCNFGNGSFQLTDNLDVHIQGGSFGSSESFNFCLEEDDLSLLQNEINAFEMYPNPANDNITVLPNQKGVYSIIICDATGRIIKKETLIEGKIQLDISDFASGIYQVQFQKEGNALSTKLVKE